MKWLSKIGLLVVSALALVCTSCKHETCDEEVPVIKYKDFVQYTDSGKLIISFIDCDGDIGLKKRDTAAPYEYNLFMHYWELQNGTWVKLEPLIPFYYRVPFIETDSKNPKLEGDIEVSVKPYYFNRFSNFDTLKFDVMLQDRALNKSNVIQTDTIVVNQ